MQLIVRCSILMWGGVVNTTQYDSVYSLSPVDLSSTIGYR